MATGTDTHSSDMNIALQEIEVPAASRLARLVADGDMPADASALSDVESRLLVQVGSDWAMAALRDAGVSTSLREAVAVVMANPKVMGLLASYADGRRSVAGRIRSAFAQTALFTEPAIDSFRADGKDRAEYVARKVLLGPIVAAEISRHGNVLEMSSVTGQGYGLSIGESLLVYAVLVGELDSCRLMSEGEGATVALSVRQQHNGHSIQIGTQGNAPEKFVAGAKDALSLCDLILSALRRCDQRVASHRVLCQLVRKLAPAQVAGKGWAQ